MFKGTSNTREQGNVGLGSAIEYFMSKGYTVLIPLSENQDYDLVVDEEGELKKVQIKTTSYKMPSGGFEVGLRTCGGNQSWSGVVKTFDQRDVDYVFVLTESRDRYCIPRDKITTTSSITVGGQSYNEYKV